MATIEPDPEATITLLTLHPDKDYDAPLRCETWSVALVTEPVYEALSYVWGDITISIPIELDGQPFQISQNLSSALRRLRGRDTPLTLWIDQLCIDQQNAAEKSRQVALMRHIYSGCRLCHVWIGELPDDVTLQDASWIFDAFEYMADYAAAGDSGRRSLPNILAQTTDYEGIFTGMDVFSGADKSRPAASWWWRIWTIQEAILPHELRVMWGPLSMPWKKMSQGVLTLTTDQGDPGLYHFVHSPRSRNAWAILIANFAWVHNLAIGHTQAMSTVFQWRHRNATDPRDKAYAVMGLCNRGDLPRTEQCNYALPVSRVFTNLTLDLILLEKNLKPLAADLKSENSPLPGWTFNVSHSCDYETDWQYIFSYDSYAACGPNTLDCVSFEQRMDKEPDVLQIPGSYADTIAHVGEPLIQNRNDEAVYKDYQQRLTDWHSLGKKHCRNEFTFWEDFGRTILGDLVRNNGQQVEGRATIDNVHNVYKFMRSGAVDTDFLFMTRRNIRNQVFFITTKGMLGLGPLDTRAGDEIWVLDGGNMPFALRRRDSKLTEDEKKGGVEEGDVVDEETHLDEVDFDYGGKCYVHGLMSGQLITVVDREPERKMVRMH